MCLNVKPTEDKAGSLVWNHSNVHMKFLLVFTICSQLYGNCMPPVEHNKYFKSHYNCATTGYGIATAMMADMGQDYVNNNAIVIGFKCEPKMDT